MKKIHTTMIVGLMAGMVMLAGCKREYGTVTLGANIDNGRDAKVYIDNLTPCWHNNDLIRVNNQTCTTSAALGSSAQITDVVESNHYRAIYPSDIVGDVDISSSSTIAVTLPRVQQYEVDSRGDQKVKVPMGAYSANETLTFHNLCSLIKLIVSNKMDDDFVLDRIDISANNAYLSGLGSAYVAGSISDAVEMESSASHDVSLFFSNGRPVIGRGDRDTYIYYIVAPQFEQDNITITLHSPDGYVSFEKRNVSLHHNKIATVSLTVEQWDVISQTEPPSGCGVLPGLFSVSSSSSGKVYFSRGNLQYCASTNTWRLAEHQYDYNGIDNENVSATYSGWIDLFGWGTSGWNSGAVCYQPWSISGSYNDYIPGGNLRHNLLGAYVEADWAWHNSINGGGNASHLWRTLSGEEWDYLLRVRAGATTKCGTGNINGIGGLIILPDSWALPSGCTFHSGFGLNWTQNSYTLDQWEQMEAAGAVFLPAAGRRMGNTVYNVGEQGNYWSSTWSPNLDLIYGVSFYSNESSSVSGYSRISRAVGGSVRPVWDNN